jgi:hypothetical protein
MLGSNYWNGDTSLFFGAERQAPVNSRCSPETSRYSSSSNRSTSKLCLVPRRGWPQQIEMLPALRKNSPSFKHLKNTSLHSCGRSHAHGMAEQLPCDFIAQQCSVLASFSFTVLFIAAAAPRAVGEVMTLSPHDEGTCSLCIIKGNNITFPDSRRLCRLCINDA